LKYIFKERAWVLKRKFADRSGWGRILKRRFAMQYIDTEEFTGYVTLLYMDEVERPLWLEFPDERICVVDNGFTWLQQFPLGTNYTVTTIFDAHGKIAEWYVDICKQHGVTEAGIPWYDDLYLDVTTFPSGHIRVLDAEELDEALQQGVISQADHELAWREAKRIVQEVKQKKFRLLQLGEKHRELLLRLM